MAKSVQVLAAAALAALAFTATAADAQRGPGGRTPTLTLYSAPGMQGDSRTFWQSNDDLSRVRFNDVAMSMVAEGRWEVCRDAGFRSICRVFEGRVDDLGGFNGLISSVRPLDGPFGVGVGAPGFGGPGFGGPGFGGRPDDGWHGGRPGGGWGRPTTAGVRGEDTVFFPGRISVPPGQYSGARDAADQFCRAQGLSGVIYAGDGRRAEIRDVLCRR